MIIHDLHHWLQDIESGISDRKQQLYSLHKIYEYAASIARYTPYISSLFEALTDKILTLNRRNILSPLIFELKSFLNLPPKEQQIYILLGKGWIADTISHILSGYGGFCMYDDQINWHHWKEYNAIFLICSPDIKKMIFPSSLWTDLWIFIY